MITLVRYKSNIMISTEEYKINPCGVLSIPYWKAKSMTVPSNIKIIHDNIFDEKLLCKYSDKKFFRLLHSLNEIPSFNVSDITFKTIKPDESEILAKMINLCYTHSEINVSADYIKGLTKTKVYCPETWIGAYKDGTLAGSVICDFDSETGEAVIEWLQVLPIYRNRGIASALVCNALKIMKNFADFATVSGECDNITNPEKVYRRCGFSGNDVWHIMSKRF